MTQKRNGGRREWRSSCFGRLIAVKIRDDEKVRKEAVFSCRCFFLGWFSVF